MLKEKQRKNIVRNFILVDLLDSQELEFLQSAVKAFQINSSMDILHLQACTNLKLHNMEVLSQNQQLFKQSLQYGERIQL